MPFCRLEITWSVQVLERLIPRHLSIKLSCHLPLKTVFKNCPFTLLRNECSFAVQDKLYILSYFPEDDTDYTSQKSSILLLLGSCNPTSCYLT